MVQYYIKIDNKFVPFCEITHKQLQLILADLDRANEKSIPVYVNNHHISLEKPNFTLHTKRLDLSILRLAYHYYPHDREEYIENNGLERFLKSYVEFIPKIKSDNNPFEPIIQTKDDDASLSM